MLREARPARCRDRCGKAKGGSVVSAYGILDTAPEAAFDEVVALAAAICGTSMAAVTIIDADRQWFKARLGLEHGGGPIERSICAIVAAEPDFSLIEFRDIAADPRLVDRHHGLELSKGFYAGVPLVSREGVAVGVLCVADPQPRPAGLTAMQRQTLQTLAGQVSAQLELRRAVLERDLHAADLEASRDRLQWHASHDPLTGLGNRALFGRTLETFTAGATRPLTLLILDLDHFKHVNDTHGHDAGDALLRIFATRLRSAVRANGDAVVRLGGDEFGVLLPGIGAGNALTRIVERIVNTVKGPFAYRGRQIDIGFTIGAAVFPHDAVHAADLIRHADVALYAGKADGRGRITLFEPSMLDAAHARAAMLERARQALADDAVVPFYQKKVDLRTGRLCGFEALLRLRRSDGGFDPPAAIAAALDEGELAKRLGSAMLRQVAADMCGWLDAGLDFGRVSINASACEIGDPGHAGRMLEALRAAGVPPSLVEVEVTEGVLLDRNVAVVEANLRTLVDAGVRIALDDFGTGYASLIHLARFPIHVLKIDRSFVAGMEHGSQRDVIVRAVLHLARALGIDTVAEGVETAAQARLLVEHRCDAGQGFLFGRPVSEPAVRALLAQTPGIAPMPWWNVDGAAAA